ncbi:MAG: flippase-like domain-containing protein [Bacteroidales bacterium]|nr:flippase-like domain-containing protein [Bacteroidales bacterium]
MKKTIISIVKYLAFLFIGLFLLWLVFRRIDIYQVVDQIVHANYYWILLSFCCAILSHLARAARWNILINQLGNKTKLSTTFYAVMIGYFANMALPRLGEITRCGVLAKKDKISFDSLFGTVVAERVFDMIVLFTMIFFVIVFQLKLVGSFVNKHIFSPLSSEFSTNITPIIIIGGIFIMAILLTIFFMKQFMPKISELSIYTKTKEFITGFFVGIKTIYKLKKKWLFLFYTFVIWFMYFLMTYFVFFTMEATSNLTIIDGITILAIGSLGMVAPVPGGLGAYHFIVKAILVELYFIPSAIAASWATLIHTSQGVLILAVGALSYFLIFLQKKKTKNELS